MIKTHKRRVKMKQKLLNFDQIAEIAKPIMRAMLSEYELPPDEIIQYWTVGVGDYDKYIGEAVIYIPGYNPEDAKDIACIRIDRRNGEVISKCVYEENLKIKLEDIFRYDPNDPNICIR